MAYTWTREWYGPESWQWFEWGTPTGSSATMPAYAFIPGGGWGLRDPFGFRNPKTGEAIFRGALNRPASSWFETFQVFVVNVASNNHNGSTVVPCFSWVTGRYYDVGDIIQLYVNNDGTGNPTTQVAYICKLAHTADTVTTKPATGASWGTYWTLRTEVETARAGTGAVTWVDAEVYAMDDILYSGGYDFGGGVVAGSGRIYRCVSPHTAAALTQPGIGANTTDVWVEIPTNGLGAPRLQDYGETTPAYGIQGIIDTQLFMAFLRANRGDFNVTGGKIAIGGSSSGGWNAAMSAFAVPLEYSGQDEHFSAAQYVYTKTSAPDAVILSITPVDIQRYMQTEIDVTRQGQMLAFMRSIFGREGIDLWAGWDALDIDIKKGLSPLYTIDKVGVAPPVCLFYPQDAQDDLTEAQVFDGEIAGGHVVNPHSAQNGWKLFEKLYRGEGSGGFLRTNTLYFEKEDASNLRLYTKWDAGGGTLGDHYNLIASDVDTIGDRLVQFLDDEM